MKQNKAFDKVVSYSYPEGIKADKAVGRSDTQQYWTLYNCTFEGRSEVILRLSLFYISGKDNEFVKLKQGQNGNFIAVLCVALFLHREITQVKPDWEKCGYKMVLGHHRMSSWIRFGHHINI